MKSREWNTHYLSYALFAGLLLPPGSTFASNGSDSASIENNKKLETDSNTQSLDEISGVIVSQTMTRIGDEFYFFFSQQLNSQYPDLKENLTIKERPTAMSGSIISVYHAQKIIYRTALSPGRRQTQERASQAVKAVSAYIVRWQAEKLFQDTFDLAHDEI